MTDTARVTLSKSVGSNVHITAELEPHSGETDALYETTMNLVFQSGLFTVQWCVADVPGIEYASKGKLEVEEFQASPASSPF